MEVRDGRELKLRKSKGKGKKAVKTQSQLLDGRWRTNLLSLDLNRSQQSLDFNRVYSAPAQRAHSLQDQHHLALFPPLLRTGSARFALKRSQDSVV